jgi:very-short-patch-repair endonuclease
VIELDEPSHARPERQTRDEEVEAILTAAGLPVVHVLTSRTYDTRELEAAIAPYF